MPSIGFWSILLDKQQMLRNCIGNYSVPFWTWLYGRRIQDTVSTLALIGFGRKLPVVEEKQG